MLAKFRNLLPLREANSTKSAARSGSRCPVLLVQICCPNRKRYIEEFYSLLDTPSLSNTRGRKRQPQGDVLMPTATPAEAAMPEPSCRGGRG